MKARLKLFLRKLKRRFLIRLYGFKNAHPTFCATFGLNEVSKDIIVGAYSYIGPHCIIYSNVEIGDYTMIANDVLIIGGDHCIDNVDLPMVFSGREEPKITTIGSDVWIGARSIIMTGVTIGNGVVVGAGSVVTKDLEAYGIYAGVPAKLIRMRFSEEEIAQHEAKMKELNPYDKNLAKNLQSANTRL